MPLSKVSSYRDSDKFPDIKIVKKEKLVFNNPIFLTGDRQMQNMLNHTRILIGANDKFQRNNSKVLET